MEGSNGEKDNLMNQKDDGGEEVLCTLKEV
jgi:hypothetical protein